MEELPPSPSTWVHIFPALRDSRKHLSGNHYSKALAEFLLALSMCSFFVMSSKKGREGTTCRTSNVIANGASSALPESSYAHMSSLLDNWPHAASLVKDRLQHSSRSAKVHTTSCKNLLSCISTQKSSRETRDRLTIPRVFRYVQEVLEIVSQNWDGGCFLQGEEKKPFLLLWKQSNESSLLLLLLHRGDAGTVSPRGTPAVSWDSRL